MGTITTTDGTEIFYKDWGSGQPIVFSHGWPLSSDDWDAQMMFFLRHGYRVIAHDRRGHGRSTQTSDGHDMDHYADDLAALTAHLDLHDAVHVGHSTGGGEVVHYIARHGESRVAKAVLISAVPPIMVQTEANPGGLPKKVFDDIQAQVANHRSEFYRDLPATAFYGFNRPGVQPVEAIIQNWWRQGMMGGVKAHYDGVVAWPNPGRGDVVVDQPVRSLQHHRATAARRHGTQEHEYRHARQVVRRAVRVDVPARGRHAPGRVRVDGGERHQRQPPRPRRPPTAGTEQVVQRAADLIGGHRREGARPAQRPQPPRPRGRPGFNPAAVDAVLGEQEGPEPVAHRRDRLHRYGARQPHQPQPCELVALPRCQHRCSSLRSFR
jgi:non-heme chloroperoxidase